MVEEEGRMLAGGGHGHLCTPGQVGHCHEYRNARKMNGQLSVQLYNIVASCYGI